MWTIPAVLPPPVVQALHVEGAEQAEAGRAPGTAGAEQDGPWTGGADTDIARWGREQAARGALRPPELERVQEPDSGSQDRSSGWGSAGWGSAGGGHASPSDPLGPPPF